MKGVFVQVRDAAGKESNIVFTKTRVNRTVALRLGASSIGPAREADPLSTRRTTMGRDSYFGSRGNDLVRANQYDRLRDIIDCGAGKDVVIKRPEDVTRNCERVIVTQAPYR